MKKRGFTMVELMVSIAIIAVVMIFLVRLLVDLKYDFTNELYDTANQFNRAEIIKTIQQDWKDKALINITDNNNDESITLVSNGGNSATISFSKDDKNEYIHYKATNGKNYKWKVEKNNSETYIQKTNIPVEITKGEVITAPTSISANKDDILIEINIPIIIDKSDLRTENDSKMDNIVLLLKGNKETSLTENIFLNEEE